MSLKHRLPELEASIDPAALRAAADEYSDLLLTLCLCMKMAGPTRANVRACASELKKRLTTWHSHKELNAIFVIAYRGEIHADKDWYCGDNNEINTCYKNTNLKITDLKLTDLDDICRNAAEEQGEYSIVLRF